MSSGHDHPDPWIRERSFIGPDKMHALGFLTLIWGSCEHWTKELFRQVVNLPTDQAYLISHDLGDVTLWEKIILIAKERSFHEDVIDRLKFVSRFHDICRVNRNTFVHAGLSGHQGTDGSVLKLYRMKGVKQFGDHLLLDDTLETIRRVCEECQTCKSLIGELTMFVAMEVNGPSDGRLTLPEKPLLPEFVWKPQPKDRPAR